MAAFLANVGVNASHPPRTRSPLRADGTFDLHPIPERALGAGPPMLRLPHVWGERYVHRDPDFWGATPTYGDVPRRAGRAASLLRAQPGDVIVFLARLWSAEATGFYLVGGLPVEDVLADVRAQPGPGWWDGNAHVRRARATGAWDSFWVFRGSAGSGLLERPVAFQSADAEVLLGPLSRHDHRTELQAIGSHTRAIRRLEGAAAERLLGLAGLA